LHHFDHAPVAAAFRLRHFAGYPLNDEVGQEACGYSFNCILFQEKWRKIQVILLL
jgi:hypothetical protein